MPFDLACDSDAAIFALYDPGAVLHLINAKTFDDWAPQIEPEAAKGNLVAYSYGGDGEMTFRLFVDEPIDPELERRAEARTEGLLRVPTGRLVASGAEHLLRPGPSEISADTFHPKRGAEQEIPPGNYAVVAFDVDWGDDSEQAAEAAAASASRAGLAVEKVLGPITGFLLFGSILGFGIAGCSVVVGNTTLRELWAALRSYGLWYAGLWALLIAFWKLPPVRKALAARARAYDEHPGAVIHLRRLPDTEDLANRTGCAFGVGLRQPPQRKDRRSGRSDKDEPTRGRRRRGPGVT